MKKLPIGMQSIRKILETDDYIYVDKTMYAWDLIKSYKHTFISRPRRFGKSLFINTLEQIFKGNKELFKRCAIYSSDYDWQEYPVLVFDFAQIMSSTPHNLEVALIEWIQDIAESFGVTIEGASSQTQLKRLILALSKVNPIVFLVDEYDSPIINNLDHMTIAEENRKLLKSFFGTLKGLDNHLRFTFITGISKFSQVSLFSGLNNLKDITLDPRYAGLMGYTEEELVNSFSEHIGAIVQERKKEGILQTKDDVIEEIRTWYNGYRFSRADLSVYNPFSTLNYMDEKYPRTYWYNSGTPSFLVDELKKHSDSMVSLDGTIATEEELMNISFIDGVDVTALMYQTGYFTIQGFNTVSKRYSLGLPNEEVRSAFTNSLVKNFTNIPKLRSSEAFIKALETFQPGFVFKHLELALSSFAYPVFVDAKERTYQAMLLSMLYGMGFDPLSEKPTNTGRIDVALEMSKAFYILELKLDGHAESALKQIREKEYYKPYTHKGKPIAIIGANFSSELRNISEWKGELLSESGEKIDDLLPESDALQLALCKLN